MGHMWCRATQGLGLASALSSGLRNDEGHARQHQNVGHTMAAGTWTTQRNRQGRNPKPKAHKGRPNVSSSCLHKCLGRLVSLIVIRGAANALCSHSLCGQRTGLTLALRATYWSEACTAAPTNAVATVTLSIVDWSPTLGVIPSTARHEDMCVKE